MESKIMQVFYGADCLPYKDKERTVHYPIIGNTFTGANNTTQIRFYCGRIGGDSAQWVAATQRPTGKAGYELLSTKVYDDEAQEYYYALDLNSWYTQYKGDIYISLHGYNGGVLIEQDNDTGIYEISGTPTIQTTGAIKIAINYAPQVLPIAEIPLDTLQDILGAISEKLDTQNGIYVAPNVQSLSMSDYENGQIFYDKTTKLFYINDNGTLTYYAIDNAIRSYDFDEDTYIGEIVDTVGVGQMFLMTLDGHKTLAYLYAPTEDSFAIHFWNEIEYGDTSPVEEQNTLVGDLDFIKYSYFPFIEKNDISGSLTDEELEILSQPNALFIIFGTIFRKVDDTTFEKTYYSGSANSVIIGFNQININTSTKTFIYNTKQSNVYTSARVDTLLTDKQNTLINQFNIKSINGQSILGSGNLDVGGGSVAEWGNITGDIQDQTDLQNELTEIREVAEGKCKTLVLNYNQNDVGINSFYDVNGTLHPNSDFSSFVSGYQAGNSLFNSNNNSISPIGSDNSWLGDKYYFIFDSLGNDYVRPVGNKVVVKCEELFDILRNGDIILVEQTEVPDRWYLNGGNFGVAYKLETSKIDLTNYATKTDLASAINGALSNLAGYYNSTITYSVGEIVIYDNKLYTCTTAITTPEAWDSTHWTQTTIANEFVNLHGSQVITGEKTIGDGTGTVSTHLNFSNQYLTAGMSLTGYEFRIDAPLRVIGNLSTTQNIVPNNNNTKDVGTPDFKWRDIYLSRYLNDGTNSYTIAESMAQFNPSVAGTTVIKWSQFCSFSLSADTTLTLETTKTNCLCEYKANITNSGGSAITITLPSGTTIKGNVSITSNTFVIPSGSSVEVNILNNKAIVVEW